MSNISNNTSEIRAILGGTIVTMDKEGRILKDGTIIIEGNKIAEVGKREEISIPQGAEKVLLPEKRVITPGLVNCHTHAAMTLLRGYADDLALNTWLYNYIFPLEEKLNGKDVYLGAKLAAVEAALSGTTVLNSMYHFSPSEARAISEVGIRASVGHVCFSWRKDLDRRSTRELAKDWHNKANGLIRVSVDPHAPYTVDPEYWQELRDLTNELNKRYGNDNAPIIVHAHLAETDDEVQKTKDFLKSQEINPEFWEKNPKGGVFEYLDALDFFTPDGKEESDVIAAHSVSTTSGDHKIMQKRGIKVSFNPISNLKLASGHAPIPEYLKKGITVGLGTDSACSNNTLSLIDTLRVAALLHKGYTKNPVILPAQQVLEMATINGAKALGWDKEIGSLEAGKRADLVVFDFAKPHLSPLYSVVSHIVYAVQSADIENVLVNGSWVVKNRKVVNVQVSELMADVEHRKEELLNRLKD
ncbi:MAG: amidohydrolase family protein [Candidatus Hodarchaeota archaeon]